MVDSYAIEHHLVCKNPACPNYGQPHFNCKCYADGGAVHLASGGMLPQAPQMPPPVDDVQKTLGMAGITHGLLGLLTQAGKSKLSDPDMHHQKIHDLKSGHTSHDDLHGHPLASGLGKKHLSAVMGRLAPAVQSQETNPAALQGAVGYLGASMKGQDELKSHMKNLLGHGKMAIDDQSEGVEPLKEHLKDLDAHPEKMLDLAPELGHYLPDHSAALSYQMAVATNYLKSLKPETHQLAPLDTEGSVDPSELATYDRQVGIASHPLSLLSRVKDGTLLPQDLTTVQTIYPGLYKSLQEEATEALIEAQVKDQEIPYKQKQTLSLLLGQPLDFTQTSHAMQAIMAAQRSPGGEIPGVPEKKQKGQKNVTSTEYKAIEKSDSLAETDLEARQINKREDR